MSFNNIPNDIKHIKDNRIQKVYKKFVTKEIKDPIALDDNKPNSIKLLRCYQDKYSQKNLNEMFPCIKVVFGNGSRKGSNGIYNKGFIFENRVYNKLKECNKFNSVDKVSEKHNRRPIQFNKDGPFIGYPVVQSIGFDVADIIVNNTECLSLKYGNKISLVNNGIKKLISSDDIKSEKMGDKFSEFIEMIGITNISHFYDCFNRHSKRKKYIDTNPKFDKSKLEHFIRTGIGYGYWMVHGYTNKPPDVSYVSKVQLYKMTEIENVKVIYPEIGVSKRFDIKIKTCYKDYTVTIRNKDGGIYPSHIMIDY